MRGNIGWIAVLIVCAAIWGSSLYRDIYIEQQYTSDLRNRVVEAYPEEQQMEAGKCYDALKERIFRDEMLKNHRRPDGLSRPSRRR